MISLSSGESLIFQRILLNYFFQCFQSSQFNRITIRQFDLDPIDRFHQFMKISPRLPKHLSLMDLKAGPNILIFTFYGNNFAFELISEYKHTKIPTKVFEWLTMQYSTIIKSIVMILQVSLEPFRTF